MMIGGNCSASDSGISLVNQNVSHTDAILDMAMVELDRSGKSGSGSSSSSRKLGLPILITSSRDGTVKLWQ